MLSLPPNPSFFVFLRLADELPASPKQPFTDPRKSERFGALRNAWDTGTTAA